MNPNTYLCPILGVYKLKLQKNDHVPPINFILMRNVLNMDHEELKPDDKVYCFDLKGSVHGRRTLDDPLEILNFEENYKYHKDLILKDIDFFQSFRKLDITNIQSERIMSQIIEDANFLSQNNFMDYSLLIYIVIKPYKEVISSLKHDTNDRDFEVSRYKSIDRQSFGNKGKPNRNTVGNPSSFETPSSKDIKHLQRSVKHASKIKNEENKDRVVYANVRRLSDMIDTDNSELKHAIQDAKSAVRNKTLYLSETKVKTKKSKFMKQNQVREFNREKPVMIFKEKINKNLRIYLVSNINDISTMRTIEKEEQHRVTTIQQSVGNNSILEQNDENDESNEKSSESASFEDFFQESNDDQSDAKPANIKPSRPSAAFFGQESVMSSAYTYGRSSIINFKNSISKAKPYERLTKTIQNQDSPKNAYKKAFEK